MKFESTCADQTFRLNCQDCIAILLLELIDWGGILNCNDTTIGAVNELFTIMCSGQTPAWENLRLHACFWETCSRVE